MYGSSIAVSTARIGNTGRLGLLDGISPHAVVHRADDDGIDGFWVITLSTASFCATASCVSVVRSMNLTPSGLGLFRSCLAQRVPEIIAGRKSRVGDRDVRRILGGNSRFTTGQILVDIGLVDDEAGDEDRLVDRLAVDDLDGVVDDLLAHPHVVLLDGGGAFTRLDGFQHHGQRIEADHDHLADQALLLDHGRHGRRAAIVRHEDGLQVGVGSQGVLGDGDVFLFTPVAPVADHGHAAGLDLVFHTLLAGVAGLVAHAAADHQDRAFATGLLADVITRQPAAARLSVWIRLEMYGSSIAVSTARIGIPAALAFSMVSPHTRLSTEPMMMASRLLGDDVVDGCLLRRRVLRLGGQVDELHTLGLGFFRRRLAQRVPEVVAGGKAGVGNRDVRGLFATAGGSVGCDGCVGASESWYSCSWPEAWIQPSGMPRMYTCLFPISRFIFLSPYSLHASFDIKLCLGSCTSSRHHHISYPPLTGSGLSLLAGSTLVSPLEKVQPDGNDDDHANRHLLPE